MDLEADLGIDSIKRVEILGALQQQYPAPDNIGPEQLAELHTLDDIAGFLSGLVSDDPVSPEPPGDTRTAAAAAPPVSPAVQASQEPPAPATASGRIGRAHATLVDLPAADRLADVYPAGSSVLIVDDGGDLAAAVAAGLVAEGRHVQVLRLPGVTRRVAGVTDRELAGWGVTELAERAGEVTAAAAVHLVVQFMTRQDTDWADGVRRLSHALQVARHMVDPLTSAARAGRAGFVTVTRLDGAFGLGGVEEPIVPAGGLGGLVKTLAVEAPELFCRAVDLSPALDAAAAAALVLDEAHAVAATPVQVGYDGRRRVALDLTMEPPASGAAEVHPPTPGDLLVVTGGARGITARCVVDLAARYRPGFLLLGRTALGEEPAWAAGIEETAELKAAALAHLRATEDKPTPKRVEQAYQAVAGRREIERTLADLRAAGSQAEYLQVDITDAAATAAALAPHADRITGLVHGAAVLADQLIGKKKVSESDRVFAPKLAGLRAVVEALPADRLRHILLFSSVAGFFGNRGQSDYAMANEVLNVWAASWKRRHPRARVTALNWGAWDSGMVSPQIKAVFEERGIALIPVEEGTRMFTEQFGSDRAGDVVTVLGPTTPLSGPAEPAGDPGGSAAGGPIVLERRLDTLAADPIVADHVIGGVAVLPAAVALGWAAGAVERLTGGTVRQVMDFAVHKGVVFDGGEAARFQIEATPAGDLTTTDVVIRSVAAGGRVRPHYAAKVMVGADPAAETHRPTLAGLPPLGQGRDASGFYTDGTLFHGESLRGLRKVAAQEPSRLVLECSLPATRPGGGAFASALSTPGAVDLLLQGALVWTRLNRNTAGLPLSVAKAEFHGALPDGDPFLVVVEPATPGGAAADGGTAAEGASTAVTVTACAPDGRVLTRLSGVSVVSTPQLAAKFVSS